MIIPPVSPRKATLSRVTYPAWPTSKPGPETTSPLSGQKPHPTRTDQMVYECYDQERGMPDVTPPTRVMRENGTRIYLPDLSRTRGEQWKPGPNRLPTVLLLS